jgi:hypothetical protein
VVFHRPGPQTLVIQATFGEDRVSARIPLGLARTSNRSVPKRVRERLEHHEIELEELLEQAELLAGSGQSGEIVSLKDGDDELIITLE